MSFSYSINKTQIGTFFYLASDILDPELCTQLIGICPTEAHRKGVFLNGTYNKKYPTRTGEWSLEIDCHVCDNIEADVMVLLERLLPARNAIQEICKTQNAEATIQSALYAYAPYPELRLSPSILAKLAKLGVSYEILWADYTDIDEPEEDLSDEDDLATPPPRLKTQIMAGENPNVFLQETAWLAGGAKEWVESAMADPLGNFLDESRNVVASRELAQHCRYIAGNPPELNPNVADALTLFPEGFSDKFKKCRITTFIEVWRDYIPILELSPTVIKKMADLQVTYQIIWVRKDKNGKGLIKA